MSDTVLNDILQKAVRGLKEIYGGKLLSVILYGSYARKDYDSESDIDIAAIVDVERENAYDCSDRLASLMSDISLEYGCLVMFDILPEAEYEKYREALPYYRNIDKDGIRISA